MLIFSQSFARAPIHDLLDPGSGKFDPGYWINYLRQKIAYAGPDRRKELGRSCRRRIRINISGNLDQKIGLDQLKRNFALERTDRSLARVTRERAAQLYHGRNFLSSIKLKKDLKAQIKSFVKTNFMKIFSETNKKTSRFPWKFSLGFEISLAFF